MDDSAIVSDDNDGARHLSLFYCLLDDFIHIREFRPSFPNRSLLS